MKKLLLFGLCILFILALVSSVFADQWEVASVGTEQDTNWECLACPATGDEAYDGVKTGGDGSDSTWYYGGGAGFFNTNVAYNHLDLGSAKCIGKIEVVAPTDGGANDYLRRVTDFWLEYSTDDITFVNWSDGNGVFPSATSAHDKDNLTLVTGREARYWRFVVNDTGIAGTVGIAEVTLYHDTSGSSCTNPPINVTIAVPTDNTSYSPNNLIGNKSQIWINGSFDNSSATSCSINDTKWTAGGNETYNFTFVNNTAISNGNYHLLVSCNLTGTSNGSDTVSFYIDTSLPSLTTTFINNSLYYLTNLTGQFNFSDDVELHTINITIDGTTIVFNITNIQKTTYNYTLNYNVNELTPGVHSLGVYYADGHTATDLSYPNSWIIEDGTLFHSELTYTFLKPYKQGNIKIRQKDKDLLDVWTTSQLDDKYSITFNPNKESSEYTFEVEATNYINIVDMPNTKYKKWLVFDEHWLDFSPYTNITFKRIADNKVEVLIGSVEKIKELTFNSIGDINTIIKTYTFYTFNLTATYQNLVTESEVQSAYFDILGANAFGSNANLTYNGTLQALIQVDNNYTLFQMVTPTISGTSEIKELQFNFTINGTSFSQSFNQTIYKINIGNCSNITWAKALTIISKDEETQEDLNNLTLNIDLNVWFSDENIYRNFSFGFDGSGNYSICIYPNSTTYLVNAVMEYVNGVEGGITYDDRKYYLDNYVLDNSTDKIYLYNIDDSKSSDVTINVYGQVTGTVVGGAYVKILRYYVDEGAYKTVEIEKTDVNGQTLAKLVLADVFYKYIVEYDREVVLDSNVAKVLSTTQNLPVPLIDDVLYSFKNIGGVSRSVSCTNATKTCRFTWSDTSNLVQSATFNIYRSNGYGKVLISSQTTEAAAGTLVYTIVEDTDGNTYMAEGRIETNTAYSTYWITDLLSYKLTIFNFGGLSSLFAVMILFIVIIFALLDIGAIGVIIGSLTAIIALSFLGILPLFTSIITLIVLGGILIAKIKQ